MDRKEFLKRLSDLLVIVTQTTVLSPTAIECTTMDHDEYTRQISAKVFGKEAARHADLITHGTEFGRHYSHEVYVVRPSNLHKLLREYKETPKTERTEL